MSESAKNQFWITLHKLTMEENNRGIEYLKNIADKYAYVLHNKDVSEDGELKTPHYHMYLYTKDRVRESTLRNKLSTMMGCNLDGCKVEYAQSPRSCIRYLVHKDSPDKYQYEHCEIIVRNISVDAYLSDDASMMVKDSLEAYEVIQVVEECNFSPKAIMLRIGLKKYMRYRGAINDLIGFHTYHPYEWNEEPKSAPRVKPLTETPITEISEDGGITQVVEERPPFLEPLLKERQ